MDVAEYGLGEWDSEKWGNHRALIEVGKAKCTKVVIPWRRCDRDAELKGVFVRSRVKDLPVPRVYIHKISRESCELAFDTAVGPGIYEVYYMRYEGTTRSPYPVIAYTSQPLDPDPLWTKQTAAAWSSLPEGNMKILEACGPLHSFYPMEVAATAAETREIINGGKKRDFLVFPEVREHPVRMINDLPFRWTKEGPFQEFRAKAERGEYFTLQLAVYAHVQELNDISVEYEPLTGEKGHSNINSESFTCFNLEGIDCRGEVLKKNVSLKKGMIQALWIGIDIDDEMKPGLYSGEIRVSAQGLKGETLKVSLDIQENLASFKGDDQPEKHSRLRWLNSNRGREEIPIIPYEPVTLQGDTFSLLGRQLELGENGLPRRIDSFFTPEVTAIGTRAQSILKGPITFNVQGSTLEKENWSHGSTHGSLTGDDFGSLSQKSQLGPIILEKEALLEQDGCMDYKCRLTAQENTNIENTILDIPLNPEIVTYILGLGFMGGNAPESFEWQWDVANKNQDALWIGSENAGIQVSLSDNKYRRPLNTNFYKIQPLVSPESWDNEGKGRITFNKESDGSFHIRCTGGSRLLKKNETVHFNFRLLITPFRTIDTDKQWNTRFCHKFGEPKEIQEQGATVINVHHANPVNPFINYPFTCPDDLKEYSDKVHDLGMKLRLYYTVRELTNHAPEMHALASLGNEIFTKGPGGGHSWLQEHFHGDYIAAWHVWEYGCVAVANSGESRWHNYYVEGLNYLAEKMDIDGVYIDDLAFDRSTMKRVRRVLDQHREGAIIDLHSANQYNEKDGFANSINLYMEHLPYLDRLWLGEYFDYTKGPDYWMTEVAGIPFGTMSEMLQDGGHIWRGMLYGMTSRYPHGKEADPRPVWRVWKEFGMEDSRMLGYWSPACPVKTGNPQIPATVYAQDDRILIALASWEKEVSHLILEIDWTVLIGGNSLVNLSEWEIYSPFMDDHQKESCQSPGEPLAVPAEGGRLLILRKIGSHK